MSGQLTAAWLLAVIFVACAYGPSDITQARGTMDAKGGGVLVGRVTMGPMPPLPGGGSLPPGPIPGGSTAPLAGAKILASDTTGRKSGSVVTDDQGFYSISLPPGSYRVTMAPLSAGGFTKDLPTTITITEGKETRLDIRIDTGIR